MNIERYKPKEQDMDEYNPTIGEVVIAIDKRVITDGNKCELKYISDNVCVLYDVDDDCEFAVHPCHVEFRPLRTETDELVEQMLDDIDKGACWHKDIAGSLIKAGYRKTKPMSRNDFFNHVVDKFGIDSVTAFEMFREGCRFLDKGE